MSRSTFIAARNSRHRTAALALYRALIRTASRIPVAEDAAQKASPVVQIVRKRFAKNTSYTSFRLIYAAMAAGYKFLNLLTKAQTPNSPEHKQILQHLQSVRDTAATSRAIPHPPRRKPVLPTEPLLINTAKADEPPKYTSNILPRPRDSLRGPRKVPSVSTTADGQPFVRLKKPQPHALSRMIGRKNRIFTNRITNILDIDERVVPEAALEDEWDRMMDDLIAKDGMKRGRKQEYSYRSIRGEEGSSKMETFSWSVQLSRLWWEWKVEKTWEDWIARGEALQDLVEQESLLAEKERGKGGLQKKSYNRRAASRRDALEFDDSPPNVGVSAAPPLPLLQIARSNPPPSSESAQQNEETHDPFVSPAWAALVKAQQGRMLKWAGRRVVGQRGD